MQSNEMLPIEGQQDSVGISCERQHSLIGHCLAGSAGLLNGEHVVSQSLQLFDDWERSSRRVQASHLRCLFRESSCSISSWCARRMAQAFVRSSTEGWIAAQQIRFADPQVSCLNQYPKWNPCANDDRPAAAHVASCQCRATRYPNSRTTHWSTCAFSAARWSREAARLLAAESRGQLASRLPPHHPSSRITLVAPILAWRFHSGKVLFLGLPCRHESPFLIVTFVYTSRNPPFDIPLRCAARIGVDGDQVAAGGIRRGHAGADQPAGRRGRGNLPCWSRTVGDAVVDRQRPAPAGSSPSLSP